MIMTRGRVGVGRLRGRCRQGRRSDRSFAAVAAVSHELREPMNGVLGMARLLAEGALSEEQRGLVQAITESAESLLGVINDVLDLSRVVAGRLDLLDTPFDPRLLLERTVAPFMIKARAKNLRFSLQVAKDVPARLRGDPGRLRQVLVNLIGNAVKFTDTGSVQISAAVSGHGNAGRLVIEVADTGPGFDAADAARLFSSHGQIGRATGRMFGGSGLGLMVSARLVGAMGGRIAVEAGTGQGARFRITLPMTPVAADAAGQVPQPVSLAGLDLLVVEPQPLLRDRLRATALGWGMGVRGAAGASDALREIQESGTRGVRFDVALISALLDDEDSRRLAGALRERGGPAVRLVSLAGSGLRGDAARARALGFDAYLAAPFSDEDLMHIMIRLAQPTEDKEFLTRHHLGEESARALHVLVADDNPVNIKLATILLHKAGHAVTSVADGAAAVAMVERGGIDLVLMDVQMPGTDGLAATRQIRRLSDPVLQKTPIVALTADAMEGDEATVRAAGMDAYLTKPIDRPKLLSTVRFWGERVARRTTGAPSSIT